MIVTLILAADPFAKVADEGLTEQVAFGVRFEQAKVTTPAKLRSGARDKPKLADPLNLPRQTCHLIPWLPT